MADKKDITPLKDKDTNSGLFTSTNKSNYRRGQALQG